MPTTLYRSVATAINVLRNRTTDAGSAVDDLTSDDLRITNRFYTEGVGPGDHWKVRQRHPQTPNMSVDIGTGTTERDLAIIELKGAFAGRASYSISMEEADGEVNVQLDPAHASQPRVDEIYLVVQDRRFGGGSISNDRIGYRKGDSASGASLTNTGSFPGPDSGWYGYLLLARVFIPAGLTQILDANIQDQRIRSTHKLGTTILVQETAPLNPIKGQLWVDSS